MGWKLEKARWNALSIGKATMSNIDRTGGLLFQGKWFGPGSPLKPVAPPTVEGRALDYPVSINTFFTPKQDFRQGVSYADLRELSLTGYIPLIIESVKDRICSIEWEIVDKTCNKALTPIVEKATELLQYPNREQGDWATWVGAIVYDMLTIDAIAIYPVFSMSGELKALDLVDGTTIKRIIDDTGRTPLPPLPAYQQILKGVPAVEYTTEDLIFVMRNKRTHTLYGYSPLEQAIDYANLAIARYLQQSGVFTEGNIPLAYAETPAGWTPDQMKYMQDLFDSYYSKNMSGRSKMRFIPSDAKIHTVDQPQIFDGGGGFDEWVARILCYAFSVSPTPFIKDSNRATASTAKNIAEEEGDYPKRQFIERLITNRILKPYFSDKIEFKFKSKESVDSKTQAEVDVAYVGAGIRTINEVRLDRGWRPLENEGISSGEGFNELNSGNNDQSKPSLAVRDGSSTTILQFRNDQRMGNDGEQPN